MNKFDQLKAKILQKYPKMTWKQRILSKLTSQDCEYIESFTDEIGYFSQSAILREYKGREYTVRFGRLNG